MFFGIGVTSSVTHAAGAPGGGVSASPKVLVVLVKTNLPARAATAASSRCSGRDPVKFRRLPAVGREGLLERTGSRRDIGDDESNQNGFAAEHLLVEEFASPILEFADRRRAQAATAVAREVEAPLAGLGV